jgi:hypothetical protein
MRSALGLKSMPEGPGLPQGPDPSGKRSPAPPHEASRLRTWRASGGRPSLGCDPLDFVPSTPSWSKRLRTANSDARTSRSTHWDQERCGLLGTQANASRTIRSARARIGGPHELATAHRRGWPSGLTRRMFLGPVWRKHGTSGQGRDRTGPAHAVTVLPSLAAPHHPPDSSVMSHETHQPHRCSRSMSPGGTEIPTRSRRLSSRRSSAQDPGTAVHASNRKGGGQRAGGGRRASGDRVPGHSSTYAELPGEVGVGVVE